MRPCRTASSRAIDQQRSKTSPRIALQGAPPGTGQTSARTDALMSRPETGKMTASVIPVAAGCHPAVPAFNDLSAAFVAVSQEL
jgi:hypothetical protein